MSIIMEYFPVATIDNRIVQIDRFNVGQVEEIQDDVCRIELGDHTSVYVKGTLHGLVNYLKLTEIMMPGMFR